MIKMNNAGILVLILVTLKSKLQNFILGLPCGGEITWNASNTVNYTHVYWSNKTVGNKQEIVCTPSPGSIFYVGQTDVNCIVDGVPTCNFKVKVEGG